MHRWEPRQPVNLSCNSSCSKEIGVDEILSTPVNPVSIKGGRLTELTRVDGLLSIRNILIFMNI